ncbi:MAG: hypothetical protein ACPKOP_01140 [Sphaerochaetaceae bacterium]
MADKNSERYSMIHLFENFIHSLGLLVSNDRYLFDQSSSTSAYSFKLASYLGEELEQLLDEGYFIDMGILPSKGPKKIIPEIIIHNRDEKENEVLLSVVIRNGYLSEQEIVALHTARSSMQTDLSLAVAILPQQDYLLIYRIDDHFVDYFHFHLQDKHCSFLKKREIGDLDSGAKQLKLSIGKKRRSAPPREAF